ncbi:MAG: peptidase and in, kexin, sedolisin [Frankiales bacterium]|nr:peptidase and in, kexin, sedolisin [Frankiales bacterium]
MTGSAVVRRASSGTLVGAFLGASCLLALPAAAGPVLQAVVSFDGAPVGTGGVQVVGSLPALHMAVVRGHEGALAQLARTPGVRGLDLDNSVTLDSRHGDDSNGANLASEGLDGRAGKPDAGNGVRIAVVDTGVSDTDALNRASGRLVDAVDASTPGQTRTGGTYPDGYGHGTFMATVIAGGAADGTKGKPLGIAPAATVLNVRVANQDGSTSLSRVIGGLEWIAAHAGQVDVANLALSHDRPKKAYGADPLTDAVEKVRDAGVTVVVASGNERGQVGDPGFDPRVLTVGAADIDTGRVAPFSGSDNIYGYAKPDVVASGVDVLGLLPLGSVIERAASTKHLPHGLFRGSGTSQATAITSGLAAIYLNANPGSTAAQVKAAIRCGAGDVHGRRDGQGLVTTTTTPCAGPDGQALDGSGDATGETSFDASSWSASSWSASSWSASSWSASSWSASSWSGDSWGCDSGCNSGSDQS